MIPDAVREAREALRLDDLTPHADRKLPGAAPHAARGAAPGLGEVRAREPRSRRCVDPDRPRAGGRAHVDPSAGSRAPARASRSMDASRANLRRRGPLGRRDVGRRARRGAVLVDLELGDVVGVGRRWWSADTSRSVVSTSVVARAVGQAVGVEGHDVVARGGLSAEVEGDDLRSLAAPRGPGHRLEAGRPRSCGGRDPRRGRASS